MASSGAFHLVEFKRAFRFKCRCRNNNNCGLAAARRFLTVSAVTMVRRNYIFPVKPIFEIATETSASNFIIHIHFPFLCMRHSNLASQPDQGR